MMIEQDTVILNTRGSYTPLEFIPNDSVKIISEVSYFFDRVRKKVFMKKYQAKIQDTLFILNNAKFYYLPYPNDYKKFMKPNTYFIDKLTPITVVKDCVSVMYYNRGQ